MCQNISIFCLQVVGLQVISFSVSCHFLCFPIFLQSSIVRSMKKFAKETQQYSGCEMPVLSVDTQGSPQVFAEMAGTCMRPGCDTQRRTFEQRLVPHPHKANARDTEKDRASAKTYMDMEGSLMMNHRSLLSSGEAFLQNAISSERAATITFWHL